MNSTRYTAPLLLTITLMTIGWTAPPPVAAQNAALTPNQVVTMFHETYGTARMDEIGPYTTAHFRDGMPIVVWIFEVWHDLNELEYETLEFKILESTLNETKDEAKVVCISKIQTTAGTTTQKEIYLLVLKSSRWLIEELYVTDEKITGGDTKL